VLEEIVHKLPLDLEGAAGSSRCLFPGETLDAATSAKVRLRSVPMCELSFLHHGGRELGLCKSPQKDEQLRSRGFGDNV
jgi:hypothetical protein